MKRIVISIAMLASLISSNTYAETYTYAGSNFTNANGAYTTAMRVTGSISTSDPIPPNSVEVDISGILTGWSFFDGLQTIGNVNGTTNPNYPPLVSTDGSGDITTANFRFFTTPLGTVVGDKDNFIRIRLNDLVARDVVCDATVGGFCDDWIPGTDFAINQVTGVWETVTTSTSTSISTLSQWSLMLLALLLGMVGIARIRRIA